MSQVDLDPGVEFHELTVAEVVEETHDARSFVFEIPESLRDAFRYAAGQFLTFRVPWADFQITRCYSLASSPEAGEAPKVAVKRVVDGRVSNWFNDELKKGARIRVRPPAGGFVLRDSDRPLCMFAGGSGITPIISLIKTALLTTERRIKLIYANRDEASIIFRDALDSLEREHGERLQIVHHLDDHSGFLSVPQIQDLVDGWDSADFYICGPGPYMDAVEHSLEGRGIERARILIERFVSAVDPDQVRHAAPVTLPDDAEFPASFRVTFEDETHEVPYLEGKTLLECARAAGLDAPFSCEEGYCSCCMAMMREGKVVMAVNDALSAKDVAAGYVLTCQARPVTSEIWIDYDE
jgi:3-ketosteroid 9alpha-monooxygenase subunit B